MSQTRIPLEPSALERVRLLNVVQIVGGAIFEIVSKTKFSLVNRVRITEHGGRSGKWQSLREPLVVIGKVVYSRDCSIVICFSSAEKTYICDST